MAAAVDGDSPLCLDQKQARVRRRQMMLMQRLRSKQGARGARHKSWTDSIMKTFRSMDQKAIEDRAERDSAETADSKEADSNCTGRDRDKPGETDSRERDQVQCCLYTLQRAMTGVSQQSVVERLEVLGRHQGMNVVVTRGRSGADDNDDDDDDDTGVKAGEGEGGVVRLEGEMFHVDIALSKTHAVTQVTVSHQGQAEVCRELADILSRGDFPEFISHLEGLQSIYRVTQEKKLKPKVFLALQSLEKDLTDLAHFQNAISGVANYVHKSPLGIVLPRSAGKAMKLIYFVSPYHLLDKSSMTSLPLTVEAITERGAGHCVTVGLEAGPVSKLQTMPLMSVSKNLPSFNALSQANSVSLPACFVLVLPQPVPMAVCVMNKITSITRMEGCQGGSQSLLSLLLDSNSAGKMKKEQRLFVSLPGQDQVFMLSGGVGGGVVGEGGVMVSRVPFTHPTHVPQILTLLRQQLTFNSLIASCVRPAAKKDVSSCVVCELTLMSLTQMTVVFEHPAHDTMVTVDIDLSDVTSLRCRVLSSACDDVTLCSDDHASRVLQR